MGAAEGAVSRQLPQPPFLPAAPWRFQETGIGVAGPWLAPWNLLHRLLLGADAASVRGRCDEYRLDRRPFGPGAGGKAAQRRTRGVALGGRGPDDRGGDAGARAPIGISP